jgi:hypothetical protein
MLWYSCLLSFYDGGKGGLEQNYYPNRAHYKRLSGVELMEWSGYFGSGVLPNRPLVNK